MEDVANADQPAAYGNPLNAERLRVSIQSNMAARGIQLVDRAQADCMVGYAMGSRQVFDTYYGGYFGAGLGFGGGFGPAGFLAGLFGFGGGLRAPRPPGRDINARPPRLFCPH